MTENQININEGGKGCCEDRVTKSQLITACLGTGSFVIAAVLAGVFWVAVPIYDRLGRIEGRLDVRPIQQVQQVSVGGRESDNVEAEDRRQTIGLMTHFIDERTPK